MVLELWNALPSEGGIGSRKAACPSLSTVLSPTVRLPDPIMESVLIPEPMIELVLDAGADNGARASARSPMIELVLEPDPIMEFVLTPEPMIELGA